MCCTPETQLGQASDTLVPLATLFSIPELKIFLLECRLITSVESQAYKYEVNLAASKLKP